MKSICISLLLFFSVAFSQNDSIKTEFPYHLSYAKDLPIAIGGATALAVPLIVGSPYVADENYVMNYSVPEIDQYSLTQNDKVAGKVSDYIQYGMVGFAALSTGIFTNFKWKKWRVTLSMYAEAFLWNFAITQNFKTFVGRPRPYTMNDGFWVPGKIAGDADIASFISGHTSTAFMSAFFISKTFADIYPNSDAKIGVWTLSIAAASLCGYFRIASGAHYFTDVLGGAVFGGLTGYFIPVLHRNKIKLGKKDNATTMHLMPFAGNDFYGLNCQFKFH